jgi:hypothetical protein
MNMEDVFDGDRLTDMEVALSLLRLMDDPYQMNDVQRTSSVRNTCIRMVERAVETFTNPFARNLLMAKLAEQSE